MDTCSQENHDNNGSTHPSHPDPANLDTSLAAPLASLIFPSHEACQKAEVSPYDIHAGSFIVNIRLRLYLASQ